MLIRIGCINSVGEWGVASDKQNPSPHQASAHKTFARRIFRVVSAPKILDPLLVTCHLPLLLKCEPVQERQVTGEHGEFVKGHQGADGDQQHTGGYLYGLQVLPKRPIKSHKLAESQAGKQEGNRQASGVNRQQKHTLEKGVACGSQGKNTRQNRTNTWRPAKGKGKTQQERSRNTTPGSARVQPRVAIQKGKLHETCKVQTEDDHNDAGNEVEPCASS